MAASDVRLPGHDAKAIGALLASEAVPAGGRLLDVPCGIGRRAVALAQEGFRVTAVDPNEIGIEAARAHVSPGLKDLVTFRTAEREALPGLRADERFDAILCLDHPIGRGGQDVDRAFLARLADHSGPETVLVLELLHRDYFAPRPKSFSFHVIAEVEQHEFRTFDPVTGDLALAWKLYRRDGEHLRARGGASAVLRLLAPHEVSGLLAAAGWRLTGVFAGWSREAVIPDRRKVVYLARLAPKDVELKRKPALSNVR